MSVTDDVGTLALVGFIAGLLVGLVPLVSGFVKGRRNLGIIGLVACAVAGAFLGLLLAIPVAIVFTLFIFLSKRERAGGAAPA